MTGCGPTRRQLLRGGLAAGALMVVGPQGLLRPARAVEPFSTPLPRPTELTAADLVLEARESLVQVLPGAPTRMWTFGGSFPGPTVRRRVGQQTRLTVVNALPPSAGSLTVHHHGGHQPPEHDGGPHPELAIPVGGERTYVYDLLEDGALQWYHDHTHFRTGRNSWMGLLGLFLVDDPVQDTALGLPRGEDDVSLVLCDRRFDEDNQLVLPFTAPGRESSSPAQSLGSGWPPGDEVAGDVFLVNGAVQPFLAVEAKRYRFRILNASNFRVYDLAVEGLDQLTQIGTESGLLPAPVLRPSVPLGPGERAEVLVDLSGLSGRRLHLVSRTASSPGLRTAATTATLMALDVAGAAEGAGAPPAVLRPLPDWVAALPRVPDRVWAFSLGVDAAGRTAWTVNGQAFDHSRVDARPELGSEETWLLVNAGPTAMSHYVHLHGADWYVLARNGGPPGPGEAGLKETFRLDPGEALLVGTRFTDHLGQFMIHCHMLEHEDHGMMTLFEVVEPGAGDRPSAHRAAADPVTALVKASMPPRAAGDALDALRGARSTAAPGLLAAGGPLAGLDVLCRAGAVPA